MPKPKRKFPLRVRIREAKEQTQLLPDWHDLHRNLMFSLITSSLTFGTQAVREGWDAAVNGLWVAVVVFIGSFFLLPIYDFILNVIRAPRLIVDRENEELIKKLEAETPRQIWMFDAAYPAEADNLRAREVYVFSDKYTRAPFIVEIEFSREIERARLSLPTAGMCALRDEVAADKFWARISMPAMLDPFEPVRVIVHATEEARPRTGRFEPI